MHVCSFHKRESEGAAPPKNQLHCWGWIQSHFFCSVLLSLNWSANCYATVATVLLNSDCFRLYGPPKANGDKTLVIYEASPARPSPQAKKTVPVNTHCHIGFVHFNITMCNQGNKLSWASQLLMIGQHWKLLIMLYGLKNCNFNFGIVCKKTSNYVFAQKLLTNTESAVFECVSP